MTAITIKFGDVGDTTQGTEASGLIGLISAVGDEYGKAINNLEKQANNDNINAAVMAANTANIQMKSAQLEWAQAITKNVTDFVNKQARKLSG